MAKKTKVEVDEGLVRQVIAGQLPLTTKVTREIEDPAQQEPQAEPEVAARDSGEETQDIPTPAPEPRRRRTMVIPDFEQTRKGSVFVGKEKRRKEQVSSSQIFDSLFCICSKQ